ncbi:ATP synthase subunit C [Hominifimenecus sp. rT4P-3]|uniref:ATP synthase subunit C n=1 Tax=Hominifimenecus sp. rT4P-3 TaxID=3242979 RepID=UPI003DA274E3
MTTLAMITLAVALVLSVLIPFGVFLLGQRTKGRYKAAVGANVFLFFGTLLIAAVVMFGGGTPVMAEAGAAEGAGIATGLGYIAAALVTGLSCIGGGIAVASAASAALGAISEDQSVLGKSLIFVGLAEGVALYGLIISFMILGKLG